MTTANEKLAAARAAVEANAEWLGKLNRPYLRVDERTRLIANMRALATIAGSAACDAEVAWCDGYQTGVDETAAKLA